MLADMHPTATPDLPAALRSFRTSLLALALSGTALLCDQAHSEDSLLPENKESIQLAEAERNPFARRVPTAAAVVVEEAESEESRLQKMLVNMEISGFRDGSDGRSVLLGRLWLRVGDELRTLIPKQTEIIRVENILNDRVEFVFLEPEDRPLTRSFTLRYNPLPTVRYLLGTQLTPVPRNASSLEGIFPPTSPNPDEETSP
jgi:hypothetical protein